MRFTLISFLKKKKKNWILLFHTQKNIDDEEIYIYFSTSFSILLLLASLWSFQRLNFDKYFHFKKIDLFCSVSLYFSNFFSSFSLLFYFHKHYYHIVYEISYIWFFSFMYIYMIASAFKHAQYISLVTTSSSFYFLFSARCLPL